MVTAYVILLLLVGAERLVELRISRRNAVWAFSRGGYEVGRGHFKYMAALHTLFLPACGLEVLLAGRPFIPALGYPMLAIALGAQVLRYYVISVLGPRWNVRVIVVPDAPAVRNGLYRYIRHPNLPRRRRRRDCAAVDPHGVDDGRRVYGPERRRPLRSHPLRGTGVGGLLRLRRTSSAGQGRFVPFPRRRVGRMTRAEILDGIRGVYAEFLDRTDEVDAGASILADLQLDSLELLTLVVELENYFDIAFDEGDEAGVETVDDLIDLIERSAGRETERRQ